jgi:DNA-binding transcriptional regulator YhcF (GntR family)
LALSEEIESAIVFRIRRGDYPPGSALPSVRELAREFGVNKNTVARAYRHLARAGYVEARRGKGIYVCSAPAGEQSDGLGELMALEKRFARLVWQARLMGLSAEEQRSVFERALRATYTPGLVSILFIECNQYDVQTLGRAIEEGIGQPLQRMILADFLRDVRQACRGIDLVVTTFYHLAAVNSAIARAEPSLPVVGVHAPPAVESLLRIARASQGSRVVVVCTEETTLNTLTNQVRTYNPLVSCMPFLLGRDGGLEELLAGADYVVDTNTAHEAVAAVAKCPVVTVSFVVDEQSVRYLRQKVAELLERKLSEESPILAGERVQPA